MMPSTAAARARTKGALDFGALRTRIATAPELRDAWLYFLDHFAENKVFQDMGRPIDRGPAVDTICKIVKKIIQSPIGTAELRLIEVPQGNLVHGVCDVQGAIVAVLFFPDLDLGMITVSRYTSSRVDFARFQTKPGKMVIQ